MKSLKICWLKKWKILFILKCVPGYNNSLKLIFFVCVCGGKSRSFVETKDTAFLCLCFYREGDIFFCCCCSSVWSFFLKNPLTLSEPLHQFNNCICREHLLLNLTIYITLCHHTQFSFTVTFRIMLKGFSV